jgi:predicted amidophosphoribosyltransferase
MPKITKQHYTSHRLGRLSRKPIMEYDYTGCSECHKEVHPTAKSCSRCGATFTGKPATLPNGKMFQIT